MEEFKSLSNQQNKQKQKNSNSAIIQWQYQVFKDDNNYTYRDDKQKNFINHDENQSIAIEAEYQFALANNLSTHTFLISGDFQKFRNKYEYAIVFEDINNPNTWYKTNTITFRIRTLRRVVIQPQQQQGQQQQQILKKEERLVNRWAEKKIVWQYKVFTEDKNYQKSEDLFMHFVNHDVKQSESIEQEYQLALLQNKNGHQFILSGDWEKDRCKWEYFICFPEIHNPDTWYKQNSITKTKRPIARIEIWQEMEEVLSKQQKLCLEDIKKKSKQESDSVRDILSKRCKQIGLNLQLIEKYIKQQVPLIIHIHLDKYLSQYVKDTQYRNQFETGKTSGSSNLQKRKGWEQRMFDQYYENVLGSERPKYGILHVTNNKRGDYTCRKYGYGNDFLILKNEVRERVTFTNKDSSYDDAVVGTLTDCCHVLNAFTDKELTILSKSAEGQFDVCDQVENIMYKEIQIHGPLDFTKDIITVNVSDDHKNNTELKQILQDFKLKFNINVLYIEGEADEVKIEKLAKIEEDVDYGNR